MSDFEQRERARERTAVIESLLSGSETGATSEIEKMSIEAEEQLKARSSATGSKAAGHAADVLKAQRMLVTSKDLGDRFLRIANRLEEIRRTSTPGYVNFFSSPSLQFHVLTLIRAPDVTQLQQQMESLRPLLRLMLRSDEFRTTLVSALRVAKHVVEQNMEGSLESVMDRGEREGVQGATKEAKKAVVRTYENQTLTSQNETVDNIQKKADANQKVISDSDWDKLANELDALFNKFQRHSEFREGINQLFNLGSIVTSQASWVIHLSFNPSQLLSLPNQ